MSVNSSAAELSLDDEEQEMDAGSSVDSSAAVPSFDDELQEKDADEYLGRLADLDDDELARLMLGRRRLGFSFADLLSEMQDNYVGSPDHSSAAVPSIDDEQHEKDEGSLVDSSAAGPSCDDELVLQEKTVGSTVASSAAEPSFDDEQQMRMRAQQSKDRPQY